MSKELIKSLENRERNTKLCKRTYFGTCRINGGHYF